MYIFLSVSLLCLELWVCSRVLESWAGVESYRLSTHFGYIFYYMKIYLAMASTPCNGLFHNPASLSPHCVLRTYWSPGRELNPRMSVLQTEALTTSPPGQCDCTLYCIIFQGYSKVETFSGKHGQKGCRMIGFESYALGCTNAGVVKLVDTRHLKCRGRLAHMGSSPIPGTRRQNDLNCFRSFCVCEPETCFCYSLCKNSRGRGGSSYERERIRNLTPIQKDWAISNT